jgi:hypothetical protein
VPDEHVNDCRATMYEKTLKPASPEDLYNKALVCKTSLT